MNLGHNLSFWHNSSSMTIPLANPTILFCTLAPTPTLHISLLELIIEGAFAVGGVEFVTTVDDTVLVSAFTTPHNKKNNTMYFTIAMDFYCHHKS